MVRNPRDPHEHHCWRINRAHASSWRSWDGEVVVYDDLSGDTMKLDAIMAEAFTCFLKAPATELELVEHLASVFDLETDMRLQHLADIAIERFVAAGLIEPLSASRPPQQPG